MNAKDRKIKKASGIPVYCSFDAIEPIIKLIPNPDNPNQHPDEQIKLLSKIIKGNGWRDRITVSNRSGMIVKGHGRYLAAKHLGLKKVPVDYQDYSSESEEIADLIADNKISEFSIVDEDLAMDLINSLDLDFDVNLAGFGIEDFIDSANHNGDKKKNENASGNYQLINLKYQIIVECDGEKHQAELLKKFEKEKIECRPLIL